MISPSVMNTQQATIVYMPQPVTVGLNPSADDCPSYYRNSVCAEGPSCPRRHCPSAFNSKATCTIWKNPNAACTNEKCVYRHTSESELICRFNEKCTRPNCPYKHCLNVPTAPGAFLPAAPVAFQPQCDSLAVTSMNDITLIDHLLSFIGLTQYKTLFESCKIDLGIFLTMKESELEAQLPSIPFGDRRRLITMKEKFKKHQNEKQIKNQATNKKSNQTKHNPEADLFVKGFEFSLTQKQLEDQFKKFGRINSCRILLDTNKKSKGCAFINFANAASAHQAVAKMNGAKLGSRTLYVCLNDKKSPAANESQGNAPPSLMSLPPPINRQTSTGSASSNRQKSQERVNNIPKVLSAPTHKNKAAFNPDGHVMVEGFDVSLDTIELEKEFMKFGFINSCEIVRHDAGNTFGLINFRGRNDAYKAIAEMNGHYIGKNLVNVCLHRAKESPQNSNPPLVDGCGDNSSAQASPKDKKKPKKKTANAKNKGTLNTEEPSAPLHVAMEQTYHKELLCCEKCEKKLVACRYIVKEEKPYCLDCFESNFAHVCVECQKPIGPDFKDLSYKEKHWHEACFKCCECQRSLVDEQFASKLEKIYCSECHDKIFAGKCDVCDGIFRGGMKKFEFKGNQWHEECFCCMSCKEPIRNRTFIPRKGEVVCIPCYEEQFAQKCTKCNSVINKGGVAFKNQPWHRECFVCNKCTKQLAGEKFTTHAQQPYCAECYGDAFANKCSKCVKPITGFGGTKFISFEGHHWHSDCFVCTKCDTSLVGRGFLMTLGNIVCPNPECSKAEVKQEA